MPGGGGTGPGRGWGAPSRTRSRSGRRRCWPPEREEEEGALLLLLVSLPWAPAAAGAALLLLLALAWLCPALASGLALALAAAAGGAWAARRERAPGATPPGKGAPLANGGPAAGNEGSSRRRSRVYREGPTPPLPPPFVLPPPPPPPRRRYPIHQAQYASLGTLPSICWDGYGRKSRLSAHNSSMVQSPVTVKIARPDSGIGHSFLLEQLSSPASFSPTSNSTLDPCAKETVLSALRESRKRVVEEEEEEEDHRSFLGGQESKRRRHDSGGSGQSAFEPLVANGAPASLVPKPGSLKRGLLSSHGSEESCSKRSRTSSLSSLNSLSGGGIPSSIRNAIASSYSSTRGLSQVWKRSGPSASPLSSTTSPRSQTPERPNKKARYPNCSLPEEEDSLKTSTSTPLKADKEVQAEKAAETALQSRPSPQASLSSSGSDGTRKRKIQLLSTRHGDHFTLPPPPQLGYPVTSEDLDAEKEAALQLFNKVLEDKTDSALSPPAETAASSSSSSSSSVPSPLTFSLALPAKPSGSMPPSTAVASNPLLESLKKMQDAQSTAGQADPGANSSTTTAETPPLPLASASLPLGTSTPVTSGEGAAKPLPLASPLSLTSTAALPPPPLLPPPPGSGAAQPACEGSTPVTSSTSSSSELSQTPARPSSAPKPSILFGILTSPPDSQPLAGASSSTTAPSSLPAATSAPVFKPIFGALAKSESPSLSSTGSTSGTFSLSPGTLPSVTHPPLAPGPGTFKPIFGGLPTSTTTASSSPFTFQPASTPASTAATAAASSIHGFPDPSAAGAATTSTLASLLSTTAGVTSVSASKPVFSFGTGLQGLGGSGGMTTPAAVAVAPSGIAAPAALPSQPLLFGAPSTTTVVTAVAPLFQFGKPAGTQGSTLGPLAGSASSTTPQAAPSTTATASGGFNIFSSSGGSSSVALTAPSVAPTTTMPATVTAASQPSLTFGLGPSVFGGGFGTASKGPPPPYSAEPNQLTFDTGALEGQPPAAKPSTGPVTFGTPFSFTGSVVQPAFGVGASSGGPQPAFGGPGSLVSFGAKSASQPAFGSSTSVFSFGAATTAAGTSFGSSTQTTASSGGSSTGAGSVFGAPAPAPFAFGASSQPAAAGAGSSAFGIGAAASVAGTGVPSVGFSFGGGQSAGTGAATPFGSSLATNPLGIPAQSSSFAFGITGTPESKPAFGGAPTPTFGQSTPTASAAASGAALGASTLSFGTPVTPAFGGAGPTFSPSVPSFSIGAGAKTGARQRLQARRQHTRKK